ncbi:MAG: acyl-CoA dehydrogenase family protein [Gammaproteobacteria bacterium]|nr:acyl-CoA dehydrogenase family protein [Gammaproteobacteria bacterium]
MIDFSVTGDAQILLDTVTRFAREHLADTARKAESARAPGADATRLYEDLGLMGLEAPGGGLGLLERCLVNETLGRADPGAALALDRLGAAGYALWAAEDHESVAAILADPARRAWLATPEDGAMNVSERAASGEIYFTPAGITDLVLLAPTGIAVIHGGIEELPVRGAGLRAANPMRLRLEEAPVARFYRTPTAGALARARLYMASLLLGVLDAAAAYARDYAMERITFGRPIAHHQAMTFMLTDMNTAVTGTRLLIQEAAWRLDTAGRDAEAARQAHEAAATAFVEAVEQSAFVGPAGVQVLGGLGFMQDYPVEKYMRESRALGLLYGGLDQARDDAMALPETTLMAGGLF